MGKAVPSARTRRKEDVLSWNMVCDIVEKKKADRPKPDKTIAIVVALCVENHKPRKDIMSTITYGSAGGNLRSHIDRTRQPSSTASSCHKRTDNQKPEGKCGY